MPKVAKPRKHGTRWEINWIDGSAKRRYQTFATHTEAKAALRARQAEADAVRAGAAPVVQADRTWEELLALWEEVKHDKRSLSDDIGRAKLHLTPALRMLRLPEITPRRISRLQRDIGKRVSVGTVRHVLGLLRAMLNLAVEHGWLVAAPKIRLPREEEKPYKWIRSEEDMARLLLAAQDAKYPGLVEFYATALYTGMRAGELCGLHWSDVDLDLRLITVQRSFEEPTKTSAIRRVPILEPILPRLREWRLSCHSSVLVFPNLQGNMHVSNARVMHQTFHRCLKAAGIERIRFHDLRHTFASHWMLKGGDVFRLQKVLGHKSISMTMRYAHLAPEAFKQDWGRFGDFLPLADAGQALPISSTSDS